MASEAELKRYRDELVRLRKAIASESATVAKESKKASDLRIAAGKTKSPSIAKSKLTQAQRAEDAENRAARKRADLERKIATLEGKIAKAQIDVDKRRAADQKKALAAIERRTSEASRQFSAEPFGRVRRYENVGTQTTAPPEVNDIFLSHASEDKDDIARPLKEALEARGVTVWYDEIKIKIGQSIRQEIEKGISHARFGVVVLSPDFFRKQWTQTELDALFSRKAESGENLILPVWHKVTKQEVLDQSPLLAGVLAMNTSLHTIDEIADALAEAVA